MLIQGEDRAAFIQRQTTNDIRKLGTGQCQISVLTSPTARILDVFTLFHTTSLEGNPVLGALTLPGRAEKTLAYLKSRIFFMDQVQVFNASEQFDQFDLDGEGAKACLDSMGVHPPESGQMHQTEIAGNPIYIFNMPAMLNSKFRLVILKSGTAQLENLFKKSGARRLSRAEFETQRVEKGRPGSDFELSEAFTPLEIGLDFAISDQKGCYTGQEVIARQITYDKVARRIVGLKMENLVDNGVNLRFGSNLAGMVTSSVISPRVGAIGLAVVRRAYESAGTLLEIEDNRKSSAKVVETPFV